MVFNYIKELMKADFIPSCGDEIRSAFLFPEKKKEKRMYYNNPKSRLSFSEILSVTKKQIEYDNGFPYAKMVCRCRYCLYCKNGKCALQSCCCMPERIQAHSCTFAEIMNNCFENIKDNVFRFRLRIAVERAAELHTCFIDKQQKTRYYEGLNQTRRKDSSFTAQTFLLSASKNLWEKARNILGASGFAYSQMNISGLSSEEYTLFCAAMDMEYGGSHFDIEDLSNDEVVDFDVFRAICYAVCIYVYGREVVFIANKRKRIRKNGKPEVKNERD